MAMIYELGVEQRGTGDTIQTLQSYGRKAASLSHPFTLSDEDLAALSGGLVNVVSSVLETGHVLKASPGALHCLTVAVVGTSSGWVLLFDSVTVPAAGTVAPVWFLPVDSNGSNGYLDRAWGKRPLKFNTGISAAFSTNASPLTKTDSVSALFAGQVE